MGVCPACPGGGGGREGGNWHLNSGHLPRVTGYSMPNFPCSSLMIRVGRPWNLLLLLVGPGPPGFL